ncbi:MAG: PAS domain-containing sensor histidine kinase [Nostoc sp. ChiQUE02]|uniref:PAS domain-containing sensor histidine kinase n=1 Tax=Nostoc sp. ChiQUE02 TaxID=3075377 RepID=UPI002AD4D735|nr:ATP-binding protein [Nostoc sp. ChiQUE02]MDZ8230600.1 ATP-binding protein [Nostoc sp. ChiQUE02]
MFNLEDFFNLSTDLFCIISRDGCYQQVNPAWEKVLGWKPENLIGHYWLELVHPEDIAINQLPTEPLQNLQWDNRYLHKDGSYRWLSWSLSTSQQGLIYAVGKDVNQQLRQIEALSTERQSLYNLLNQLPAFLYLQPNDYGVGFYNQRFQEVFGDPTGKRCYEAIAGLKQPCPVCPTFRVFETNAPQLWEWVDSKTGNVYQIYDYPFKNMNGEPMVVEMGLDITAVKKAEVALRQREKELTGKNQQLQDALKQLKKTQAQLIQTEKMSSLGQLVAGVAHEINNPISFINGNVTHAKEYVQQLLEILQLYQQEYPDPLPVIQSAIAANELEFITEDLKKLLESMKTGSERIRDIVVSLRNFSRLDEAQMKTVDIHSGIESTLLILQNRLKDKSDHPSIEIIKEYGQLPLVECYAGQLNQVLMNILTNAIDALENLSVINQPHNPQIVIRTLVLNLDWIAIEIADNGIGMSQEVQQRLFDPFFTTKPVGKGTGLGMSISYQIITEKHQGHLNCISSLGAGTKFIIEIPIQQIKPVQAKIQEAHNIPVT